MGTLPCFVFGCEADGCAFEPALAGTLCNAASCTGFHLTATTTCNGTGSCSVGGGTAPCPGGFVCHPAGVSCATSCADGAGCQPTHYCAAGDTCQPKRGAGEPCISAEQCQSAYCNNGSCCAGGTCCNGQDSDCDDEEVCTTDLCNASFKCDYEPNATICVESSCDGLSYTNPKTCNAYLCSDGGAIRLGGCLQMIFGKIQYQFDMWNILR